MYKFFSATAWFYPLLFSHCTGYNRWHPASVGYLASIRTLPSTRGLY